VTAFNLIGSALIQYFIPKIGHWSKETRRRLTVISIFTLTYTIITLFPVFKFKNHKKYLPNGLTKEWFLLYGQSIFESTFTTNFLPYVIGPLKDMILIKCCKKKRQLGDKSYKLNIEQKYGLMLNVGFVVMTFCY